MGYLFNDLGPNFEVKDSDGEEPQEFECTIQSENGVSFQNIGLALKNGSPQSCISGQRVMPKYTARYDK